MLALALERVSEHICHFYYRLICIHRMKREEITSKISGRWLVAFLPRNVEYTLHTHMRTHRQPTILRLHRNSSWDDVFLSHSNDQQEDFLCFPLHLSLFRLSSSALSILHGKTCMWDDAAVDLFFLGSYSTVGIKSCHSMAITKNR